MTTMAQKQKSMKREFWALELKLTNSLAIKMLFMRSSKRSFKSRNSQHRSKKLTKCESKLKRKKKSRKD